MAEIENEVDNDDNEIVSTDDYDTDTDDTELTVDDYNREKARREKAEKTLVELKKQLKEQPKTTWEYITKDELEIEKFITKNPDLEQYKEDLNKYKKMWISLEKAKLLIENDDKTIENRKKTNSMNITEWETTWKTTYDYKELAKMSQTEYNKIKDLEAKWKVVIKR